MEHHVGLTITDNSMQSLVIMAKIESNVQFYVIVGNNGNSCKWLMYRPNSMELLVLMVIIVNNVYQQFH